jgi:ketosteroid isomerase-like protein
MVIEDKPHPNAEKLAAVYADFGLLAEHASDDIVLHAAGSRGILTGDYFGMDAVLAKEMELFRRSGETLVMTPQHIVADDHFGVVMGQITANRNGRPFEGHFCGLWRFEQGRIVEHWEHCADWPAAEQYFVDDFDREELDAEKLNAGHSTGQQVRR